MSAARVAQRRAAVRTDTFSLTSLRNAYSQPVTVNLTRTQMARVRRSAATVDRMIARGGAVYGVNTGFGLLAQTRPFDDRIHILRRQPGQRRVARALKRLLAGSRIRASHINCERVQDPYSLRCQPQVMGACLDVIESAGQTLVREANAVTDNPLVFATEGEVLLTSSRYLESALRTLRRAVPRYDRDRFFAPDIAAAAALISSGSLSELVEV